MKLPEFKIKKSLSPDALSVVVLVLLAGFLRFYNLGYSDYIGDEQKAMLLPEGSQATWNFLIKQRKGPMQFLVSYIPRIFVGNFNNELAERIPFALFSVASVWLFYALVKKLTKDHIIALSSAFLFMVNGFIVGFGRIAQYQNLNIFFSLLSLYFYSDFVFREDHLIRRTLLGTLFWCLSILSHWDGVFIIPVVAWFFITFLRDQKFSAGYKIRVILYNFILGCLILLPFMVPYIIFHSKNPLSEGYFQRRIGLGYSNNKLYKMFIDLYNPFFTFWLLIFLSLVSLIKIRKEVMYVVWFIFSYILFELFVRKPGTHIYNFLIPVFILSGFGFASIFNSLKRKLVRKIILIAAVLLAVFLYYQSYLVFVDHSREYPWETEEYLVFEDGCLFFSGFCDRFDIVKMVIKTKEYYYDYEGQKLPLFGFPHSRNWKEINDFVNVRNSASDKTLGYSTNEDQSVSGWYMDASYRSSGSFYFVGISRPTNFVIDPSPPHGSDRELIKNFVTDEGKVYARVWLVEFNND